MSLRGITKGYTTIDEAKAQGLFHPNCIHHFGVTFEVLEEYERIEAGNATGTLLQEVDLPPTKQREKTDKNSAGWSMADILKGYTGNDKLVKDAFSMASIDAETAEILANINKLPAVKVIDDAGKGYFNPARSILSANNRMTFLHEFGHSIDFGIIKASSKGYGQYSKKLSKAIQQNRINRIDKFPADVAKELANIRKKYFKSDGTFDSIGTKNDGWNAVSDIFCALTNGNMFGQSYCIAGHPANYYRQSGCKEAEIFAQYFFLRTNNCKEALNFLKKYKPDFLKCLEELFTMYVKDIKNL